MPTLTFHLIVHTHWDREWYLSESGFGARLVPLVDDLLDRLESDSEFRSFLLDGQTVLLEDYLRIRPEQRARVQALVHGGRLGTGPWYVQADEQVPSGESLLRNLLLGARDCRGLGGRLDVLYSPDAFGHPPEWPALAREFGIGVGVLWRGLGLQDQESDLVRWAAPDGRAVLVYHLPPDGYEVGVELVSAGDRLAEAWRTVRGKLEPRAATTQIAVFVGADHHPAPVDVAGLVARLEVLEPSCRFRISSLPEYFRAVEDDATSVPELSGELRWSYGYTWTLQGVHATRAPLKRQNSALELILTRQVEPLAALASMGGGADRRPLLEAAWRPLVQNHLHDPLGGCCSDPVAVAMTARFERADSIAAEIGRSSLYQLVRHDPDRARENPEGTSPRLFLWNPAPRSRAGIVTAEITFFRKDVLVGPPGERVPRDGTGYRGFSLATSEGTRIPVQELSRSVGLERMDAPSHHPDQDEVERVRIAFRSPVADGLALLPLTLSEPAAAKTSPRVEAVGRTLRNQFVEATVESDGSISLSDPRTGRRLRGQLRLESEGDAGDCYTYAPVAGDRPSLSGAGWTTRVLAGGPFLAAIEALGALRAGRSPQGRGPGRVEVRLVIMLDADSPVLRCLLVLDNGAIYHRLRARLSLGLTGVDAVAGTQFGSIARPPVKVDPAEYPAETPVATAPSHRWVGAARGETGLLALTRGFQEYEWTPDGDLLLTLLRSVGALSRGDLPTRPGHAGWPTPTPLAQCLGKSRVEIGLAMVTAAILADPAACERLWEDAFLPISGSWIRNYRAREDGAEARRPAALTIALEGRGLVASSIKPAESGEGIILRCFNASGEPVQGAWRFGGAVRAAFRVRADENQPFPLTLEEGGTLARFPAGPREIVTVRVD